MWCHFAYRRDFWTITNNVLSAFSEFPASLCTWKIIECLFPLRSLKLVFFFSFLFIFLNKFSMLFFLHRMQNVIGLCSYLKSFVLMLINYWQTISNCGNSVIYEWNPPTSKLISRDVESCNKLMRYQKIWRELDCRWIVLKDICCFDVHRCSNVSRTNFNWKQFKNIKRSFWLKCFNFSLKAFL